MGSLSWLLEHEDIVISIGLGVKYPFAIQSIVLSVQHMLIWFDIVISKVLELTSRTESRIRRNG